VVQKLTTPHPFQEEGINRLQDRFGGRGLIADDPGLGKTLQSSVWALRHLRPDQRPIVVVCPASVKYQWQIEVLRHAGFRAVVLEGTKPDPKVVPLLSTVDVVVLNYDILGKAGRGRRSWNNVLRKLSPTLVIGDECQYLKNPNAARTKNFRDLQDGVPHLIFLGGTGGMENYPIELFPVLNMLRPDKFPSYAAFGDRYCDPQWTPWGKKYKGVTRAKELYRLLRKTCVIRRRKADVLKDLPPLVRSVIPVVLPRPAMAEYVKAETDLIGWLRETYPNRANKARKAERMVKMGYLKHLVGRLKLPQATQFIDDQLTEPGKVLAFGVHREVVQAIQDKYGRACVKVDGGVTGRKREAAFEKFRKDPNVRLLSGNIDAAGAGWNGQAASRVVTIELAWKPTPHVQAESRAHRDGQKNTVFSYYLIARDTIEELLAKVQQVKQQGINAVLDGEDVKSDLNTYDELEKSLLSKTRPTLFGGD